MVRKNGNPGPRDPSNRKRFCERCGSPQECVRGFNHHYQCHEYTCGVCGNDLSARREARCPRCKEVQVIFTCSKIEEGPLLNLCTACRDYWSYFPPKGKAPQPLPETNAPVPAAGMMAIPSSCAATEGALHAHG